MTVAVKGRIETPRAHHGQHEDPGHGQSDERERRGGPGLVEDGDVDGVGEPQRRQVEQSLRDTFRSDPVETSLVGWTAMGLFELSRKRERAPTARLLEPPR